MMHNAMNLQLPRSPISPSPPEVEIPSVDARMQGYMNARYFEEYGHIFYPDVGATSSTPAPGEGVFGPYTFYGATGPSGSVPFPPPPVYGFHTFGTPGTSTMAPLHTSQSEASRPSAAEIIAQSTAASIFGSHPGMSSIATCLNSSLDIATTSLEATTLPENAYLTSNLWIGIHDWGDQTPSDATGNGGNGQ